MKKTGYIISGIVFLLVLTFGGWAWRYYTAEIRGVVGAKEKIESAQHRLYSYEYFYDMYATIQSYETALQAQKDMLKSAETQSERQRIRSNIAGIKSQKRRAIEKYNAEARKTKTKGKFRADDLPYQIKRGSK